MLNDGTPFRRRTLLATAASMAATPARALNTSQALIDAANKEAAVVFYTSVDVAVAERITQAFTAAFPAIRLRIERSGAERILQRLMQEYATNLHEADVVESSDITSFVDWKSRGWMAPFIPDDVAQYWPADQKDKDGCFATVRAHLSVVAYNTRQVKPEAAPKTYNDLLLPQWRMRMVKAHPAYSGTILTGTEALVQLLGWDWFEKLAKQRVMQVQSSTEPPKKVAQGERSVMADGNEYNCFFLKDAGEPIEIVYPPEGVPLVPGQAGILKDAPHPNAARLFANFLFSQECQQLMADAGGLRSFHPKVTLKPGRKPLAEIKVLNVDPTTLAKDTEALKARYAQVFGV
jgi:iron(III) transport system substrate-binding protein